MSRDRQSILWPETATKTKTTPTMLRAEAASLNSFKAATKIFWHRPREAKPSRAEPRQTKSRRVCSISRLWLRCPLVMYARRGAAQRICSCRISLNLQLDFEPKQLKQPKQPKRPNSRIPTSSFKAIECGVFLFSIWLTGTRTRTRVAIEVGDGYRKENINSLYHQKYQMEYNNGSLQISCKLLLPTKPIVSDSKEITPELWRGIGQKILI